MVAFRQAHDIGASTQVGNINYSFMPSFGSHAQVDTFNEISGQIVNIDLNFTGCFQIKSNSHLVIGGIRINR